MQLTLKNFRCYESASFTLPTFGMTLLHGKTGAGKSTIFNAIVFALYGKIRRPYTHGAKTCTVKLYDPISELTITRTRTPNRLLVNYNDVTYEDSAAQGIIEKVLNMTNFEFMVSSYFDQRKQSSILSMSPAEQLEFVEEIALNSSESGNDNNCEETKNKTKNHIKNLENTRAEIKAKLDYVKEQVKKSDDELNSAFSNYKFPENFNPESIKSQHSDSVKELQSLQSELEIKRTALEKIRKDEVE